MKSWIELMIRFRWWVIVACLVGTVGVASQIGHLVVVSSSDDLLPQSNSYIVAAKEIEKTFGHKYTEVIGVTATRGTIYQTPILEKIRRITQRVTSVPEVVKEDVTSLASPKLKSIEGTSEGMTVRPLMERVPQTPNEMEALTKRVASNGLYQDLLVSKDQKTTLIVADVRESKGGFRPIDQKIRAAVDPERDSSVDITLGGMPTLTALAEQFSERMGIFLLAALLIAGLIHYEAFRTAQALILPLVTAIVAVIWSISFLSIARLPLDVFNATTPILILAIAAGHAVQILKRYYEEFGKLKGASPTGDAKALSRQAIVSAMVRVGPVMFVACTVAALGFFSLCVFEIRSIRMFGVLTGFGIVSAMVLEFTFIPALRSVLPPPSEKEVLREKKKTVWDRLVEGIYHLVLNRRGVVSLIAVVFLMAVSLGGYRLKVENSLKRYFDGQHQMSIDDEKINTRMMGSNVFYVLLDTGRDDGIKDPAILEAMSKIQTHLAQDPLVGKTVSFVDFIKRMNQAMNADRGEAYVIPTDRNLIAQYLLMYSTSGDPGDFDSYVDNDYRKAVIQVYYKSDVSKELGGAIDDARSYAQAVVPPGTAVRIGGGMAASIALNDEMVRSKMLNILQILACVLIVSSIVFRSLWAGILILTPLVATVFANFGFMGLFGIPLNIPNALTSAMAVGVGADYAIYLSFRLREELRSQAPEAEAIRHAFLSAGKATLFVATAVAGGFGVLVFSKGFNMHIWMGILIALAMLVSAFSTLTMFSALILTLRPKFIFEERRRPAHEISLVAA